MNDRVPDVPDPLADGRPSGAWSPSSGLVGLAWTGTAAAAAWCVLVASTGDRPGLLLAAVAVLGLGFAAAFGTRARPRLRVDSAGLTVGGLSASRHYPWSRVGDVRVLTVRRLGRASTVLEIDVTDPGSPGPDGPDVTGPDPIGPDPIGPDPIGPDPIGADPGVERLLVFGRLDLDDDPHDVAAVVRAARPR